MEVLQASEMGHIPIEVWAKNLKQDGKSRLPVQKTPGAARGKNEGMQDGMSSTQVTEKTGQARGMTNARWYVWRNRPMLGPLGPSA